MYSVFIYAVLLFRTHSSVGTFSGHEVDKFKKYNISYEDGLKLDIPVLTDAYFAYECRTISMTTFGDLEWIAGENLLDYQDKDCFLENGLPDLAKLKIPLYVGCSSYRELNQDITEKNHPLYLER
ncbi:flavin reductase [Paenibacillus sp. FSL H7-0331]|uniref:flavin reductase n=1 Tax=Paenibacillus sp. FSL H7-0331 TaxID=1920421 RepID=UPI002116393E|nr:hypothetical protein [Paenibacillus sp. FSL H7-0331]